MKGYGLCVDRLQLQQRMPAHQVFAPLTNAARTVPANPLSSLRETRIFSVQPNSRPNQQSIVFSKQSTGLPPGIGTAVRRDLANGCFAVQGG